MSLIKLEIINRINSNIVLDYDTLKINIDLNSIIPYQTYTKYNIVVI